jgi:hypothetical protein
MNGRISASTFLILLLLGCAHSNPVQTTFDPAYPERNGAGDAIVAVFDGRIPCAAPACEMRKVELVLYGRDDGRNPTTYWLGQTRVGMGNGRLVQQGTWAMRRGVQGYPDGLMYALDSSADPSLQYFWRVNDDIVLVLGPNLRPRVGNAAWGFMLSRDCARTKRFVPVYESNCPSPGLPSS